MAATDFKAEAFQSTRPRGARHDKVHEIVDGHVSIHAPAGGATKLAVTLATCTCFNPRARGGRDN